MRLLISLAACIIPLSILCQSGYISDEKGGCKSFTFNVANRTNAWSGSCKNGFADGYGTLKVFERGKLIYTYIGNLENGKFNGKCTLSFYDNTRFEGSHSSHVPSGVNRKYLSDASGYMEGEFDDSYKLINGAVYNSKGERTFTVKNGERVVSNSQNNYPVVQDLLGTWVVNYTIGAEYGYGGSNVKVYYTFYENFRVRRIEDFGNISTHTNGTWKLDDDLLFIFDPYENTTAKIRTVSYNGQNWRYKTFSDNNVYNAKKLSDKPKYLPESHPGESGNNISIDAPDSDIFDIHKMYGTWKSKNQKDGSEFYFILYPDQRICQISSDGEVDGSWTVIGNKFYFYVDFIETPFISKTSVFSKTSWKYQSLDDGAGYTASKISEKPDIPEIPVSDIPITKSKQNAPTAGTSEAQVCAIYSESYNCMVCYGTCKEDCHLCGGSGKNSNNGYDCTNCDYGKVECSCKCRAHDGLIDVSLRSKKVPCNEVMIGTWKSAIGEFTFYPNSTGNGYLVTKYSSTGSWVIEDGLLKMFFYVTESSVWEKYYIKDFDNTTLILRPVEGYGDYTFRKVK